MKFSIASVLDAIPGLPPEFRYPVGYFESEERVAEKELLSEFDEIFHPYVIRYKDGKVGVDHGAPMAVKRLKNGQCPNLISALRYLELDGAPDQQMESTYDFEDLSSRACNLSEAGHHGMALEIFLKLPVPFQETASALESRVRSLKALARYDEALPLADKLIAASDVATEYARGLFRIVRAEILVLLNRVDDAQDFLNRHREELHGMFAFFGVLSAVALKKGNVTLAKQLVAKAGRVDDYHAFKILWNPALREIADFIREELLTDDGKPKMAELNSQTRRFLHSAQGALLHGDMDAARGYMDGVIGSRITDWSCAHEAFLALIGVGQFDSARRLSYVLPGYTFSGGQDIPKLIRMISDLAEGVEIAEDEWIENLLGCEVDAPLALAFRALKSASCENSRSPLTYGIESRIVEVSGKWRENDRELWVISLQKDGVFRLCMMHEPRERRSFSADTDPRTVFPVVDCQSIESVSDAVSWIEEKLHANVGIKAQMYSNNPYELHFNGWGLLRAFPEADIMDFPHLQENWRIAADDPNFYFSNGTLFSFGMHTPYAERLYQALFAFLNSQ